MKCFTFIYVSGVDAALLLGYTIHFIYCIWGNLRITVAELIAAVPSGRRMPREGSALYSKRQYNGSGDQRLSR